MNQKLRPIRRRLSPQREGGIVLVGVFALVIMMSFVGFSVDLGTLNLAKTRMQATADAAALAAVKEIQVAIQSIAVEGGDATDVDAATAYAIQQAGQIAAEIAELNDLYLDPAVDLQFGRRVLQEDGSYALMWDGGPYNVVRARIRKDNPDTSAPDGKLKLLFAPLYGERKVSIQASATAYIESRDIVSVLDFSGSMSYDTGLRSSAINAFGQAAVEGNLDDIWDAMSGSDAAYSDDQDTAKFPSTGFGKINTYSSGYYSGSNSEDIFEHLELGGEEGDGVKFYDYSNFSNSGWTKTLKSGVYNGNYLESYNMNQDISSFKVPDGYSVTFWDYETSGGNAGGWIWGPITSNQANLGQYNQDISYIIITYEGSEYVPFPQEGRDSDGEMKGKPSKSSSKDMWISYIKWVRDNNNYGYRKKYNYRTLMAYLVQKRLGNQKSEDLWRAPVYPFHAMKEGMTMFTEFLESLSFGDTLGLATYATTARRETALTDDSAFVEVDLGEEHLTLEYGDINTIQRHKQAGHYDQNTNIGDGIKVARELLDEQGREGVRPTLIVMTDGNANRSPDGFSLPAGWDWAKYTDFDGDGSADYSTTSSAKKWAFYQASLAIDNGYTVHTMAVGAGADRSLMNAIAFAGNGRFIDIEAESSVEEMREELESAFVLLAGDVPAGKLLTTSTD